MAKKIQLEFDIDNKDVKLVSDSVLTLTEQVRFLKKELQKVDESSPQFEILKNKFNETKDQLDKVNIKSREFFGTMSALPGPIGQFSGALDNGIDTLKTFTSFSFKDIKSSLGEVAKDFGDIVTNIGKATGITKIYTTLNNALSKSFVAVGVGEEAAAVGARAFSAALVATGIGALIVGLGMAVSALMDYANAAETAAEKQKELNEANDKMAKETLDVETQAVKRMGDLDLARAKSKGATADEIYKIDKQNKELLLSAQERYYNSLSSKDGEEGRKTVQTIKNTQNEIKVLEANHQADLLKDKKAADEKQAQLNKQHKDKIAADNKTADQSAIDLTRENAALAEKDERKRQDIELQNAKKAEEDKIKALEISKEKKAAILKQIDDKYTLKQQDVDKKRKEDDLKAETDFNKKIAEIKIAAIENETNRGVAERENKLSNDLADLEKDKEFIKKSEIEKAEIRKNLTIASENDIKKIKLDAKLKSLQEELSYDEARLKTLQEGTTAYFQQQRKIEDDAYALKVEAAKGNQKELERLALEHKAVMDNINEAEKTSKRQQLLATLDLYQQFGAELQQLAGKNKGLAIAGLIVEQAAGVAKIIINTQAAAAKAGYFTPLGIATLVAGAASVATAIAATVKGINQINSSSEAGGGGAGATAGDNTANLGKNYGEGGMIDGPRHAQGGVMINAEGGEAVMTRGAVTMFAPLLSQLNQMGGGTSFSSGATGGSRPDNASRNNPAAAQEPMIMKTYVVSSELTSEAEKQAKLKDLSTL